MPVYVRKSQFASGDHYTLYLMLTRMGFRPPRDAMDIYRMAEDILAGGYDE
jgi:hypothetical protein